MITLTDYWMGRDVAYGLSLTPDIQRNAARTVDLINALLAVAKVAGVTFKHSPTTGTYLSSGWRPPAVNATTKNASKTSLHMTGEAGDVYDEADRLDAWLMTPAGQKAMADLGLWHEHPSATPNWAHVQTRPPKSGNRTFYP